MSSIPVTFKNVSCWPANEASGRSSAVADERTANEAPVPAPLSARKAARIAASRSAGNGWASTRARMSAPTCASALTSSVSRPASMRLMRPSRSPKAKNSRKACAVVAKPVGTLTPAGSWEIISPRLAFLPPTASTSVILRFSNGTTRAVELNRADIEKLQKLKAVCPSGAALLVRWPGPCRRSDGRRLRGGQSGACGNRFGLLGL